MHKEIDAHELLEYRLCSTGCTGCGCIHTCVAVLSSGRAFSMFVYKRQRCASCLRMLSSRATLCVVCRTSNIGVDGCCQSFLGPCVYIASSPAERSCTRTGRHGGHVCCVTGRSWSCQNPLALREYIVLRVIYTSIAQVYLLFGLGEGISVHVLCLAALPCLTFAGARRSLARPLSRALVLLSRTRLSLCSDVSVSHARRYPPAVRSMPFVHFCSRYIILPPTETSLKTEIHVLRKSSTLLSSIAAGGRSPGSEGPCEPLPPQRPET